MKSIFRFGCLVFITFSLLYPFLFLSAQSPQKLSFQSVIRNTGNLLVTNQAVGMQVSILQGAAEGTAVYVERHNTTSNANGLVTIEIGGGDVVSGNFTLISWAEGPYFIKTETDPAGGSDYTITGISQLLSVPYALHSKTAEQANESDPKIGSNVENYLSKWNGNALVQSSVFDNGNVYIGSKLSAAGYGIFAGNINAYNLEVGGTDPTETSGQATIYFHHGNHVAHQLRYAHGVLHLEAAGIGYGTTNTPAFSVGGSLFAGLNGGNVGIGTNTPADRLHVIGDDNNGINATVKITTGAQNMLLDGNEIDSDHVLTLNHNSPANVSIANGGGNVGIGTLYPAAKLDVHGTVNVNDNRITGLGNPVNAQDAATKAYVDARNIYSVGDFAHGGIVFWVDATGQHGLVCAKSDQVLHIRWYAGTSTYTMAGGDGPKAGFMNTAIIIANQGYGDGSPYAARLCNELKVNQGVRNYGDWYLPSKEELNLMFNKRETINNTATENGGGAFVNEYYWSSTEYSNGEAWRMDFSNGTLDYGYKFNAYTVRAVRAF